MNFILPLLRFQNWRYENDDEMMKTYKNLNIAGLEPAPPGNRPAIRG